MPLKADRSLVKIGRTDHLSTTVSRPETHSRRCEARLVSPGDSYKVSVSILGRHPALKHDATRTRHREQIAIPRRLRGVGGQRAVGVVVVDELPKVGE